MSPIVHGLETEYIETIKFIYLDVTDPDNSDNLSLLGYRYHPHFFLLDGQGNIIQEWVGPASDADFRNVFDSQL